MSYPLYSRAERWADGTVHLVGVGMAIAAVAVLFVHIPDGSGTGIRAALIVYSVTLILMLSASGAYHSLAYTVLRPALRRLDHAAIYVKIAGTFTPLAVLLGSAFGYVTLGLVWVLALIGAAAKLLTGPGRMRTGAWSYLALGWLGLALFVPLTQLLPWLSLGLIAGGGLLYSLGVLFYTWETLRFSNAIWHGFVVVASGCFFAGIAVALPAMPLIP
ncbi:PAQR family membrane homeostasis protein TrhA [Roseovarius aquimarinus]|uniref:Hemolysin III family protein n=1 Tax=Roseovarius aquimarinus TaxID=1229156 RepID=A0ABW7I3C6_9RHOB